MRGSTGHGTYRRIQNAAYGPQGLQGPTPRRESAKRKHRPLNSRSHDLPATKTAERTKDVLEIDVQSEAIVLENVAYASFQGVAPFVIELGDLDWVGSPRTITDVKLSTVGSSLRRDDIFFTGNSVTVPITPAFWDYGAVATIGLVFDQDNKVVPEPTSAIVWAVLGIAAMSVMIRCRLF